MECALLNKIEIAPALRELLLLWDTESVNKLQVNGNYVSNRYSITKTMERGRV